MVQEMSDDFLFGEDIQVDPRVVRGLKQTDKRAGPRVTSSAKEQRSDDKNAGCGDAGHTLGRQRKTSRDMPQVAKAGSEKGPSHY